MTKTSARLYRDRLREQYAEYAVRAKTCSHTPWQHRMVNGALGGTWRWRCSWCNELMWDTLWEDDND